jgi:hypothetical protein
MQDGTVTTKSSHSRMGSVGRPPAGFHSELGTGVHALQSCLIYTYSRVLGHGQTLKTCLFLMFWDFYPPPSGECGEPWLQLVRGELLPLPRRSDCNY